LEHDAKTHECDVLVLNLERLSSEQDMAPVGMTIVHCCSSRRDGLSNDRKQLNEALHQELTHAPDSQDCPESDA